MPEESVRTLPEESTSALLVGDGVVKETDHASVAGDGVNVTKASDSEKTSVAGPAGTEEIAMYAATVHPVPVRLAITCTGMYPTVGTVWMPPPRYVIWNSA